MPRGDFQLMRQVVLRYGIPMAVGRQNATQLTRPERNGMQTTQDGRRRTGISAS